MSRKLAHVAAGSMLAVLSLGLAACGASKQEDSITLTVATFSEFGYERLFAEYEEKNRDVQIKGRISDFDAHHRGLVTALATGRGAADVVAIEEQYLPQLRASHDKFVNLAEYGADEMKDLWVDWKWQQGVAEDGSFVLGLGTDMGSLAMCYRKDLFAAAGLPTSRDAVGRLWSTWEDYARVGDRFTSATPNVKFADSAGNIYASIINQSEENYFSKADDTFIADRNESLKHAFFLAGRIGENGQTAGVTPFTQPWNVAIKQGRFATITCPAWMLELIRDAGGPEGADKWDVAAVPGGGGNRGGSFLTVPEQSKHPKEAFELAKWLTAPEQQKRLFLNSGLLPSQPSVYNDPEVLEKKDSYFNDAPIGKIFAVAADKLRPNHRGVDDAAVRPKFGDALSRVEEGKRSVAEAWSEAIAQARNAIN